MVAVSEEARHAANATASESDPLAAPDEARDSACATAAAQVAARGGACVMAVDPVADSVGAAGSAKARATAPGPTARQADIVNRR
jgi:hypothetical protein